MCACSVNIISDPENIHVCIHMNTTISAAF